MVRTFDKFRRAAAFVALAGGLTAAHAEPVLTWSLVYDQTVISTSAQDLTRSLRALALSPDGSTLYAGFIQKSTGSGVLELTLSGNPPIGTPGDFYNVTGIAPSGTDHQPKAVATDDRGLVFIGSSKDSTTGDNARIIIQDASLTGPPKVIALTDIAFPGNTGERVNGLSLVRIGGTLYLYTSREHAGSAYVERYVVGGNNVADTTLTLDTAFSGDGRFNLRDFVPGASDLRGMEVAADGTIYVTSRNDDKVYRISADLSSVTAQTVNNAIDLALFDHRVFVTSYDGASSQIYELLDTDLSILSSFDAFATFPRDPALGNIADTGYSGIDIDSFGRIYLADQLYFRPDMESRDRVLVSSPLALMSSNVPEPSSLALIGIAMLGIVVVSRRRTLWPTAIRQ